MFVKALFLYIHKYILPSPPHSNTPKCEFEKDPTKTLLTSILTKCQMRYHIHSHHDFLPIANKSNRMSTSRVLQVV